MSVAAGAMAGVFPGGVGTAGRGRVGHLRVMCYYEANAAEPLMAAIAEHHLTLAGLIPADPAVNELDAMGEPIVKLPADAPSRKCLEAILTSLNGGL